MDILTIIRLLFGLFELIAALPAPLLLEVPARRDIDISAMQCNDDDLLQALEDAEKISSARVFCSSFLQPSAAIPASKIALMTPASPIVAERKVLTVYTADAVEKGTSSVSLTVTSLATPFSTPAPEIGDEIPYPPWLPTTNEVSRVSSACSCIISNSAPSSSAHNVQARENFETAIFTAVSPPCSVTMPHPSDLSQPTTISCSVHGLVNANTTFIQRTAGLTHVQCHDGCKANPQCLSSGFLPYGLSQCLFMTADVKSVYKEGSEGAEWVLNDRDCLVGGTEA
jgi:hypothetical protein